MSALPGIIGVALGAFALVWGYNRRSYHQAIAGTPTTRVLDVDQPGRVELKGEVVPVDDDPALEAPLSGESCVAAGWKIEEWEESGDNASWHTIGEGYEAVPFHVDDGSAEIRVEPGSDADASNWTSNLSFGDLDESVDVDGVTVDFERLAVEHQLAPEDPKPGHVEEFERRVAGVSEQTDSITNIIDVGNAHGERKYNEGTIHAGDDVYLLGTVAARDGDAHPDRRLHPSDAVVRPGDDEFILSTRSEAALLDKSRYGLPAMVLGAVLFAAGVGALVLL
jgi:hypothetical protein